MSHRLIPAALVVPFLLSACGAPTPYEQIPLEPEEVISRNMAPPGAAPGTCWGRDATPAVIETVTEQVMVQPAEVLEDGSVTEQAIYKTETQQQIVTPRQDTWFQTPCESMMTPEFTSTVQRALKARGHYNGPITGKMDGRTQSAIRAYQKPQGLDSGVLSLAAARQMGLLQVDLENVAPPEVAVAAMEEAEIRAPELSETAAAEASRLTEEQAAAAIARAEQEAKQKAEEAARAAEADRIARAEAAAKAEAEEAARIAKAEAEEAARIAQAEADARAAEAARIAEAERAAEAARQAEAEKIATAQREKNKRAKELAQALEDEKRRTGGTTFEPLPISTESY